MTPRLDAIGLVVSDMAASLAFYRRLGLQLPAEADAAPHAEATLPSGLRVLWDTEETIRSFDPQWTRPAGGERLGLAFVCDSPAEVDSVYDELVEAGYRGHLKPWDAFWGQRYAVQTQSQTKAGGQSVSTIDCPEVANGLPNVPQQ
ncbi:VOC family protein, partial [Streptomyces sp. NPDC051907]|uniref:VOC family protein n=1 Tax=Streptomyces sp. NPDC051907 TaxID=3155284 RepID=UPI00342895C6